jgi:putative spermidine/putrescine transport system ATP-binding protein
MYLQVKHLNKSYGSRRVVSDVNLTMEEGEILSLLGPSGCGKTTILRMIAGLVTPDSGIIEVGGRLFYDGKREVPAEERDLGMVFQDYALWPHMTVAQNIAFGLRLRRKPSQAIKQRVQELLELVNLPGLGDRYPYQLSGGQQQRVAVARALATEPRVLLLDEPLSSLDTALRETVSAELVQLFKRLKITAINVTHDQNEAMTMSDRILVLRDGQVQQIGAPAELYMHPANAFVASFMGPANIFSGELIHATVDEGRAMIRLRATSAGDRVASGIVHEEIRARLNGHASLVCRPDDVRVYQEEPGVRQGNVLPGRVAHASFVAGRWRTIVNVMVDQECALLAFAPSPLQPQQQVWVELPPERCLIVPA